MLLRWLILHLCVTRAEIRLVLRTVSVPHVHHVPDLALAKQGKGTARPVDRRVARSFRLALLAAVLMVHADNPRLVAGALVALPAAMLLLTLWHAGLLR